MLSPSLPPLAFSFGSAGPQHAHLGFYYIGNDDITLSLELKCARYSFANKCIYSENDPLAYAYPTQCKCTQICWIDLAILYIGSNKNLRFYINNACEPKAETKDNAIDEVANKVQSDLFLEGDDDSLDDLDDE